MAGSTDKRVIQMQFENKQFEKNIAKSTKSVDDLKKAMNFEEVTKGMKKFTEGTKSLTIAGFDKLSENIQKLTDKFTGLGTISELVLSQIRRGIEQLAARFSHFLSSMTTAQISEGMEKYNMLNKSVQTIKAATGESEETVYRVLERLNQYTDQTSYNFADMAQNIGKFTSVGIDLESAERQMEGIANWAARSGAGTQEASRAMYNLSQAMGVGKLTKIDWKSIENAGMATKEFKEQLIQSGLAAGTLIKKGEKIYTKQGNVEVTYQNMAETLQKGWATRGVLSDTLEKYYYDDLYYENEDQKALIDLSDTQKKEFDKMIASGNKLDAAEWKTLKNMGAITDTNKEKIVDLAVKQGKLTKEVTKDGKTIYKTVNKTGKQVEFTLDNIEDSLTSGWFDKSLAESATSVNSLAREAYEAAQKCLTFTDVLNAWKDQVSSGWMTSMRLIFGDLSDAMEFFSNVCNRVGDGLGYIIDFRNEILKGWSEAGGRQSLIDILLGSEGGFFKTGTYGFLDMIEEAAGVIKKGLADFFYLFMDPEDRLELKKDPDYIKKWMAGQLIRMTDGIKSFMNSIKKFLHEDITVNGKTTSRLEIIQNIVSGISGAMKLGYDTVTELIKFIGEIGNDLGPGFNEILGFFGDLGKSIFNTADEMGQENKIHQFFVGLHEDILPITTSLNELLMSIADLLRTIFGLDKEEATQTKNLESIGNIIRKVARIITKVVTPVINFINRIVEALDKMFKNGVNGDSLKQFGKDLGGAFGDMIKAFTDSLPDSMGFVKDWVNKLFGGTEKEVKGKTDSLFSMITGTKEAADKLTGKASSGESKGPGIMGLMTGSNIAVWLGVASLAGVVLLLRKARKVVGSIGDFFIGLGDTIKNGINIKYKDETFATKFLKIAGAIALIAAAVIGLALIPLPNLLQGVGAVIVIMAAMFVLFKLLQKSFIGGGDLKTSLGMASRMTAMAAGFTALAVAIGVIALALIPFTLMSWDQYAKAMAGLGGILLQMIAFMALMKLFNVGGLKISGFAGFAIGIGMIVQGILPFANMSWGQYAKAMAGLGGVLLELIAFMGLMRLLDIGTKGIQLLGIVAFALGIAILIQAIKPFASMSWDQYSKVMAGLGGVLLELIAFMGLMRLLDIGTKGIKLSGMVSFALAIVLLVQAIMPFKDMSWDQYAKVMSGLGGILLELIAFMGLMRLMDIGTKGIKLSGIVSFALAIVLLVQAIMPFKDMSWDQYAKVMSGLGGILLELIAFMGLMRLMDIGTKGIKLSGFALFVFGLKFLIEAIMPFKDMGWDQYAKVMAGLGGVLLELIAFMGLMKVIGNNSLNIAAFMPFAYGIQALINSIIPFASMSWEGYAKTMAGLGGVLVIMLGFMALLKLVKPSIKNMLQMAIFAGIFAAVAAVFAVVLGLVKDMDWKVIAAFSAGLAVLVAAFSVAAGIASIVGIKGFAILAAGLAIIAAAIALIAPLLIGSIVGAIRDASASLVLIADMISQFSGSMGGVSEGDMDHAGIIFDQVVDLFKKLVGMVFQAGNVHAFMYAMSSLTLSADEIIKFDNKMSKVSDDGNATKASEIIALYKDIVSVQLAGFDSYMGNASSFYDVMFKLGSAFDYFDGATKNIANADDNPGFKLIKELAACAPQLNTIYRMDLGKFRTQLAELGGAMIVYAQGAKEVGGEKITEDTDVSGAVTLLRKISDALTKEGGFTIPDNMPTDDQLTTFGVQLAALAGALVKFEEAGGKLGSGKDKAIATLGFFRDLKAELALMPNFGSDINTAIDSFKGKSGEFVKSDELTIFAEDIAQLGSAMAHFAESTQIVDEKTGEVKPIDFSLATTALDSIASLGEKLPAFGGVKKIITGRRETLGELAEEVNLLGSAIGNFYKSTTDFSATNGAAKPFDFGTDDTGVIGFLNSICDIQNRLPRVRSFSLQSLFENDHMSFGQLSEQLVLLGSGLHKLSDALSGETEGKKNFDAAALTEAANLLNDQIVPLMTTLSIALPKVGGLGSIISTAFAGRTFNLSDLGKQLGELGTGIGTLGANANSEAWKNNEGFANAFNAMDSILAIMIRVQQFEKDIGEYFNGFGAFKEFEYFIELLSDNEYNVVGHISTFMQKINDSMAEWAGSKEMDSIMSRIEAFKMFTEGLNSLITAAAISNGNKDTSSWTFIGNNFTNDIATSITDGTESVLSSISTLFVSMQTRAKTVEGVDWQQIGKNIVDGIALGIDIEGEVTLWPSVERMMNTAYEKGKEAIDSNSPSKLFMKLGSFMGEGTAIGIKQSTDLVGENAKQMGDVALENARDVVGLVSRIMAESTDTTPTIAPILDMTNIDAGLAQFKDRLSGYGIALDTSNSAGRAAYIGTSSYEDPQALKPDYSGIYQQMDKLGNAIQKMGQDIRKMKLVLDTGAVAGGVADILDEEYGRRQFYESRE